MTKTVGALVLASPLLLLTAPGLAVSEEVVENGLTVACAQPVAAVQNPLCGRAGQGAADPNAAAAAARPPPA